MNKIEFFLEALKHFGMVGTVMPSSRVSAQKMIAPVDFNKAKIIVELGGGTGSVTREILRRMNKDAKLFVFETNHNFAKILTNLGDERLKVLEDSVVNAEKHLKPLNIRQVDYVISTLPLAIMDETTNDKVLEVVGKILKPGGRYVQIQYSLISKDRIKRKFPKLKIDFTLLNFPPAFDFFHRLFFQQGTYTFDPANEVIVRLYPENLFVDLGIVISRNIMLASAAIILAGSCLLFKSKRKS